MKKANRIHIDTLRNALRSAIEHLNDYEKRHPEFSLRLRKDIEACLSRSENGEPIVITCQYENEEQHNREWVSEAVNPLELRGHESM